jgi:hypothetical protein
MQVVEEFAAFLDLNKPEELRPEVAEWGRMRLRTLVDQLSDDEKRELAQFLQDEHANSDGAFREWIEQLPDRLGLPTPT